MLYRLSYQAGAHVYCIRLMVTLFSHCVFRLPQSHLADGGVLFLSVARRSVPRQLHGQAEVNDGTRAVGLDQNVSTIQVSAQK